MAKGGNFSVYMSDEFKDRIDYYVKLKNNKAEGNWTRSSFIRTSIAEYMEKCMSEYPNEVIKKESNAVNK